MVMDNCGGIGLVIYLVSVIVLVFLVVFVGVVYFSLGVVKYKVVVMLVMV